MQLKESHNLLFRVRVLCENSLLSPHFVVCVIHLSGQEDRN